MATFTRSLSCAVFAFSFALQAYAGGGSSGDSVWKQGSPSDWNVEVYPVFVWAPFMGASATLPQFPNLPSLPDLPGGAPGPSAKVSSSLNGAAFFKVRIEKSKWAADMNVLWAGVSASTDSPRVKIKADVIYGQGMLGREVLPDLWLEGGARRLALNVGVTLLDFPEVSRKPGLWDPLVGISYRHPIGKKLRFDLHADGGGFGVGSDVDAAVTGKLDWRFSKHFGTSLGWGFLHLKISDTVLKRTLTLSQTLNGPILGFGIFF
jgi:hypothetical protein